MFIQMAKIFWINNEANLKKFFIYNNEYEKKKKRKFNTFIKVILLWMA